VSNVTVRTVKFDNVTLAYINEEGTGSPLFLVDSLAKAFGVSAQSGYWYQNELKHFTVKRKTERGKKKLRFLSIDGVYTVMRWRKPVWEQDFREQFVLFEPEIQENSGEIQEDKSSDNLPKTDPSASLIPTIIKRMERQDKVIERLVDAVETLQAQTGPSFFDVPRQASQVYTPIGKAAGAVSELRKLHDEPIYTHVPGYRTYKELLADHGLPEFINTHAGRVFSKKLAGACGKNGIQYYLVLDAYKMAKRKGVYKTKACAPDTYTINAYPRELWDVVGKRLAQEMVDNATKKS
jgi:hypothetical protein